MRTTCLLCLACVLPAAASAGERPLREAASENGAYRLRLRPGHGERRPPQATLLREQDRRERVWRAELVNDVAPEQLFISDNGKHLVAFNEFRAGGARHAIAVYDHQGELLAEHELPDALAGAEWRHVRRDGRAIRWLTGARLAFDLERGRFVANLRWGRRLELDLTTGEIVDPPADTGTAPAEFAALLEGELDLKDGGDPNDMELDPLLALAAQLLDPNDPNSHPDEAVLQQMLALLNEPDPRARGEEADVALLEVLAAADSQLDHSEGLEPEIRAAAEQALSEALLEAMLGDEDGLDEADGPILPPDPNARNPVDYMRWMNDFRTGGEAALLYDAAIANMAEWEGDYELYDAAMSGDPDALADPAIVEWLDDNAEALAQFRAATRLEYSGRPLESEDGTMIAALLPNLSPSRQLAKIGVMEGRRLENEGLPNEAVDIYMDLMSAGRHHRRGTTLIEDLVGVATEGMASEALLDAFANDVDGAIDYDRVLSEWEARDTPARPFADFVQFERAFSLDITQRLFPYNEAVGAPVMDHRLLGTVTSLTMGSGDDLWSRLTIQMRGFQGNVDLMNGFFDDLTDAVSQEDYQANRAALGDIEHRLSLPLSPERNSLLALLAPSLSRAHYVETRGASQQAGARAVAGILAYRQRHGALPESLDALAGGFTVDPFTGAPFAYELDGDDFSLYSLGGNGVDDGARHDPQSQDADVVYWPRPPKD